MRAAAVVPAYQAARTVGSVVVGLRRVWPDAERSVLVVDDGSTDGTARAAQEAGAIVVCTPHAGKGSALRAGFRAALEAGFDVAVTVDADGQHPADEAARLLDASPDPRALVLGCRDLAAAGAPRANRFSNAVSNFFLSRFTKTTLHDTQCGLRRYPLAATLALSGVDDGYAYEAEILLRALAADLPLVQLPVRVVYPAGELRTSHFDAVRDPARIIVRVLATLSSLRRDGHARGGAHERA